MISRMLKFTALFAVLLCAIVETKAQAPLLETKVTVFERAYEPLTTEIWSTNNYWYSNTRFTGLPWDIVYDGRTFNTINMYTHGGIGLENSAATPSMDPDNYGTQDYLDRYNQDFIYVFWVDQDGRSNSAPYGEARLTLIGTAPDRQLVFEWKNQDLYRYSVYEDSELNYQVRFYERTGAIEICYGVMNHGSKDIGVSQSYGYETALIGFTAKSAKEKWINVDPNGNGSAGYKNWEAYYYNEGGSGGHGKYSTVRTNADFEQITSGTVVMLGAADPSITGAWPAEDEILVRPNQYGNSGSPANDAQKPGVIIENVPDFETRPVTYELSGPISFPAHPNYQTIYSWTGDLGNGETRFNTATGVGAGAMGSLNLSDASIKGGLYNVYGTVDNNGEYEEYEHFFYIANTWDIEISKALDPKSYNEKKYPLTSLIPVKLRITNKGVNPVGTFYVLYKVYDDDNTLLKNDSLYWEADPGMELQLGSYTDISMESFRTNVTGDFRFEAEVRMVLDEELSNNTLPWAGQPDHIFTVAPEIEAAAFSVIAPKNVDPFNNDIDIYVGRPMNPHARFQNNGITDISEAPVDITIQTLPDLDVIYTDDGILPDIPQGLIHNQSDYIFDEFVPPGPGLYRVCVTVSALDDEVASNNMICDTFEVIHAMAGVYTIGPDQSTGDSEADRAYNDRNFLSFQEAVDALYLKGVTAPVTFELTTNNYVIGDMTLEDLAPAIDLRTQIIGMNETNTVTFKPSLDNSVAEGMVNVHLYSGSGIGFILGQATISKNQNAIANNVPTNRVRQYANSTGYFVFDGGPQRSVRYILHSDARLNAAFYFAQGASNNQVKNCIIASANPAVSWTNCSIPLTSFNEPQYAYEPDSRSHGTISYSSGIIMRSIPPQDNINHFNPDLQEEAAINSYNIDTLVNQNNFIDNNEISGFSYGVVSLGIGPLMRNGVTKRYYNKDNIISNNFIHDVSRAGVFLGHEENVTVSHNKISGVASSVTGFNEGYDVGGIIAGGEHAGIKFGYNNINMTFSGNEISNVGEAVNSATPHFVYGVKVEQCKNTYQFSVYPDVPENTTLMNNLIWGIRSGHANTSRIGVRLFTLRNINAGSVENIMVTPLDGAYLTRNDLIVNNTIIIDNDGYNTQGAVAGVALQQTSNAKLFNNAIAMLDDNNAGATNVYSGIFYQGIHPNLDGGIESDRNVYWLTGSGAINDSAALYRFIFTDDQSKVIYEGLRNEFLTMNQWQMYTKSQDFNSINYDFTRDLTNADVNDPDAKLRINNDPSWPVSSKLNNLGFKLDYVLTDIDGNYRGTSGQRYDIGAFEFPGIMLNSDIEVTTSHEPGAYRATTTTFSDAEYIMTQAPVEIKAELRNNGSLFQSGVSATLRIYRENPAGGFYDTPELEETILANVESMETNEINFNLADGVGKEFYPGAYGDWKIKYQHDPLRQDSLYNIPGWYKTMQDNVTPLYKIVITAQADEEVSNNVYSKTVRFYLKRAGLNMLISTENSFYDMYSMSSDDILAGRRNYDSLVSYLEYLGLENSWIEVEADTVLKQYFDTFERSAWEPRAVDYTLYRTMMWADADENPLTREEMLDIEKFTESGSTDFKKNLVVASQEMSRVNYADKEDFVKKVLRAEHLPGVPTDPLNGVSYNAGATQPAYTLEDAGKYIVGETVGRLHTQFIMRTGALPLDPDPMPGLMSVYEPGEGLARIAYKYNEDVVAGPEPKVATMGTAITTLKQNTVYLGVDWRHFADGEALIRSVLDFMLINGSDIIPVELVSFDAEAVGERVELTWETASELNSDRFEIERADVNASGVSMFSKIGEEDASGKSSVRRVYGPIVDKNIEFGSTYAYRLKMIDLDGDYEYSEAVELTIAGSDAVLGEAIPNPAINETTIKYVLGEEAQVEIAIYDMTGKKVLVAYRGFSPAGENTLLMDLSSLNSGVYNYVLTVGEKSFKKQVRVVQ